MGLIDFVRNAGSKIFGGGRKEEENNVAKGAALAGQVATIGLKVENLQVSFDDGVATLTGTTPSQAEREKIVLIVGNTHGVSQVNDQLVVDSPAPEAVEPEATYYTVKSGDTLSGIARTQYGNAGKYPVIFEANKPMLKDPNKIYPGQVLRIPPID